MNCFEILSYDDNAKGDFFSPMCGKQGVVWESNFQNRCFDGLIRVEVPASENLICSNWSASVCVNTIIP